MTQYNPAYMLDYQRFMSDSTIDYVNFQQRLLREYFPQTPITTNTWFCDHMPDFYKLFDKLDFCSYDNYGAAERYAGVLDAYGAYGEAGNDQRLWYAGICPWGGRGH